VDLNYIIYWSELRGKTLMGQVKLANQYFRKFDTSYKFPICSKFNATNRAINRIRNSGIIYDSVCEYVHLIDSEISDIINKVLS
jgi:hypothetical protein